MGTTKAPAGRSRRQGTRAVAPAVDSATVVVGCWLVLFATVADYGVRHGPDAATGDAITGSVLLTLGVVGALGWIGRPAADTVRALVGLWLVLAPLLVDFGFGRESTLATYLDVVLGTIVAAIGLSGRLRAG